MSGTRLLVAKLKADPSLGSEAERVRAFRPACSWPFLDLYDTTRILN